MTQELRVEAVISGRLVPSSRFRVLQHVEGLAEDGIDVHVSVPAVSKYASVPSQLARRPVLRTGARWALEATKVAGRLPSVAGSWRSDLTWLEREMVPGALTLEPALRRPVVFDLDDAVWMLSEHHERTIRSIARRAAIVVAGNDFLAEWLSDAGANVTRVFTAIDTRRFHPTLVTERPGFTVGWTGSASSLPYLETIGPALAMFLERVHNAQVVVICDRAPALPDVPRHRLRHVPWTPDIEAGALQDLDVGLMPLPDRPWARGKCAFKMLQYMATGIPAVVSPVGMNAELLAMGDCGLAATDTASWVDALCSLAADRPGRLAMGERGRRLAESTFSLPAVTPQLAAVFHQVA